MPFVEFLVVIEVRFVAGHVDGAGLAVTAVLVVEVQPDGLAVLEQVGNEVDSLEDLGVAVDGVEEELDEERLELGSFALILFVLVVSHVFGLR